MMSLRFPWEGISMQEGILIGLLTFAGFGAGITIIGLVFDVLVDRLTKPDHRRKRKGPPGGGPVG